MHIADEAACAVAALLDFAAIGVEDAVIKIGVRLTRTLDLQDLVTADPEMAVGKKTQLFGRKGQRMGERVQNDEVVAQSVHFSEF
jgi:hypothetical protein